MAIYKRCSRCGKRIPSGSQCSCIKERHREYDRYSRDKKSKQFYTGKEWEAARAAALAMDEGIDVYLFMTASEVVAADTVHHIIPLRDDWTRKLDLENLMSLHHDTHSMIEQLYRKDKKKIEQQLLEMLRAYRRRRGGGG